MGCPSIRHYNNTHMELSAPKRKNKKQEEEEEARKHLKQ
jgi:hypothetical protein